MFAGKSKLEENIKAFVFSLGNVPELVAPSLPLLYPSPVSPNKMIPTLCNKHLTTVLSSHQKLSCSLSFPVCGLPGPRNRITRKNDRRRQKRFLRLYTAQNLTHILCLQKPGFGLDIEPDKWWYARSISPALDLPLRVFAIFGPRRQRSLPKLFAELPGTRKGMQDVLAMEMYFTFYFWAEIFVAAADR